MTTTELTYNAPTTRMDSLLTNGLVDIIRTYFDDVHKIKPQLPKILRDSLVLKGAHPIAVIPENTLDAIINAPNQISTESLNTVFGADGGLRTVGIIGPGAQQLASANRPSVRTLKAALTPTTVTTSLESLAVAEGTHRQLNLKWLDKEKTKQHGVDSYVTFHDNPNVLKLPIVREQLSKVSVEELYLPTMSLPEIEKEELSCESVSMEDEVRRLSFNEAERVLYKKRTLQMRVQAILPTQDQLNRPSVAEPLLINLPYEATFPVFLPGEENKHVAYIVLVDQNGYFVTDRYTDAQIREMAATNDQNSSFSSAMMSRLTALGVSDAQAHGVNDYFASHLEYCARVYGEMIEADFVDRVSNGRFSRTVSLSDSYDLGRIMLARRLAEQQTQILFLPREIVSYFAFDYRKDGVGQSILDQIKPMLAMRMALMMGNLLGQLKNSIGRTKINAKLDEDDTDPLETKEKIIDEVVRSRQLFANFPTRVQGPVDVLNYLASAGIEFTWEEHPSLPNIKLDVSYENTDHTLPSADLEEEYKKRTILKFGIPPEQVDAALGPDFAVQAINSNVMFGKQVMQRQMEFCEQLSEHIRRIVRVTPSLYGEMVLLVERNIKHVKLEKVVDETQLSKKLKREIAEKLVREFIDGLEVGLPAPNSVTHRNQIESMKDYSELLDEALTYIVNPEFLAEATVGVNLADHIDLMKASIKALKMREFMANAGITPELSQIGLADSDGRVDSVYDAQLTHARQLTAAFTKFFEKIQDPKDVADARLTKNTDLGESSSSSGTDTGSSSTPPDDLGGLGEGMPDLEDTSVIEEEGGTGGQEAGDETGGTSAGEDSGTGEGKPEETGGQPTE